MTSVLPNHVTTAAPPRTGRKDLPGTSLGAIPIGDGECRFTVWAPHSSIVRVRLLDQPERLVEMQPQPNGYHIAKLSHVSPGTRYRFVLACGSERPDPASRLQPDGVHGPSEVFDPAFGWTDDEWSNSPLDEHVFYELHVGTFTPDGTFEAVISRLDHLIDLGITALQLMPVAQFPGTRNWGYDGVGLFAVQNSYGGPRGLQRLVDACHKRGLAVYLDVVYNHLGPEGNYLHDFGPYFTDRYHTPWGAALNFDGPHSDDVRQFFISSAMYFLEELHVDGFRLDAVHAIVDNCPTTANHDQADADGDGTGDACPVTGPICGNGVIDPAEDCDGGDLDGKTCASLGYTQGTLGCDAQCKLDSSGCACMDGDGDGWGNDALDLGSCDQDCNDADGSVWSKPGAPTDLTFVADTPTLYWAAPPTMGCLAGAVVYDTLRSDDPSSFDAAHCVEGDDDDTTTSDFVLPPPGTAFFYLARAQNACPGSDGQGSLGQTSGGQERTGRDCS